MSNVTLHPKGFGQHPRVSWVWLAAVCELNGIWRVRRSFFFRSGANRRGHRLGRLLLASHPAWRATL